MVEASERREAGQTDVEVIVPPEAAAAAVGWALGLRTENLLRRNAPAPNMDFLHAHEYECGDVDIQ